MSNSKKLKALADLTLSQTDLLQLLTIKIDVLEHLFLKHLPNLSDDYQQLVYDTVKKKLPELSDELDSNSSKSDLSSVD